MITVDMTTVGTAPTRRQAAEILSATGVSGALAERMLRRTAPARHATRVEQARSALLAAADGVAVDLAPLVGALVAHLDAIGVGVTGRATDRHPALEGLGKGRKQATDGGAWSAAITKAAEDLPRVAVQVLGPADPRWHGQDSRPGLLVSDGVGQVRLPWEHPALPVQWLRRLAEEAVAHLCGAPNYTAGPLPVIRGSAVEWAALWQTVHRAIVVDRVGTEAVWVPDGKDPRPYWVAQRGEALGAQWRGAPANIEVDGVDFRLHAWASRIDGPIDRVRAVAVEQAVQWPEATEEPAPDDIPAWELELQARAEVI